MCFFSCTYTRCTLKIENHVFRFCSTEKKCSKLLPLIYPQKALLLYPNIYLFVFIYAGYCSWVNEIKNIIRVRLWHQIWVHIVQPWVDAAWMKLEESERGEVRTGAGRQAFPLSRENCPWPFRALPPNQTVLMAHDPRTGRPLRAGQ